MLSKALLKSVYTLSTQALSSTHFTNALLANNNCDKVDRSCLNPDRYGDFKLFKSRNLNIFA